MKKKTIFKYTHKYTIGQDLIYFEADTIKEVKLLEIIVKLTQRFPTDEEKSLMINSDPIQEVQEVYFIIGERVAGGYPKARYLTKRVNADSLHLFENEQQCIEYLKRKQNEKNRD